MPSEEILRCPPGLCYLDAKLCFLQLLFKNEIGPYVCNVLNIILSLFLEPSKILFFPVIIGFYQISSIYKSKLDSVYPFRTHHQYETSCLCGDSCLKSTKQWTDSLFILGAATLPYGCSMFCFLLLSSQVFRALRNPPSTVEGWVVVWLIPWGFSFHGKSAPWTSSANKTH